MGFQNNGYTGVGEGKRKAGKLTQVSVRGHGALPPFPTHDPTLLSDLAKCMISTEQSAPLRKATEHQNSLIY